MELPNPHQQILAGHPLMEEAIMVCPKSEDQRKARPHPDQQALLKCPRCSSTNTKFCYYNNYSLTQPRYFCKGCKRYWTQGGSLRNVPVGGACRKITKRSSSSSSSSISANHKINPSAAGLQPSQQHSSLTPPPISYDPNDLTLAFAANLIQKQAPVPAMSNPNHSLLLGNPNPNGQSVPFGGFLDMLRSGGFVDHQASTASCTPSGMINTALYYGLGVNGDQGVRRQASSKDMDEAAAHDHKVFMAGLPWQQVHSINGDHVGSSMAMVDSGREFWSSTTASGVNSSWHGLINNPLI